MRTEAADAGPPGALAILVKRFPRLSETFVLNEFLELRRQGLELHLFALMDSSERQHQPEAAGLLPEVGYLRRPWPRLVAAAVGATTRHPAGVLRAVQFARRRRSAATWRHLGEALVLVGDLDRLRVRHLHAHFAHSPAAVAHLAHLVSGIAYSFTAHAKDLYTTPAHYVLARSEAAELVVTCTEANRRHMEQAIGVRPEKILMCGHGVELARFEGLRREPVEGRILSVGRLVPKKGFDVLVRACAELARRRVPFSCVICGDGPERAELVNLISALGLEDRVQLVGARPQPELLPEYGRASVFALAPVVMPDGDRDGIPNVILEAMAAGVPVVAGAVSAIPEVVVDGTTGRLVPPGDPVALADALGALLSDPDARARLGQAGRAHVVANLDLARCVTPLAEAFARCLGVPIPVEVGS